jgi:hypothetical protein
MKRCLTEFRHSRPFTSYAPFGRILGFAWVSIIASGCSFGPRVLEATHSRYAESIRQVADEEFLLNLVHLRYSERPRTLNVSSIAAQHEVSASAGMTPFFNSASSLGLFKSFSTILPNASASGANRPTLTLIPADNAAAIERLLSPIPHETLLMLTQTSWPTSTVIRLWLERLNGVPNAATASGPQPAAIPDYARFRRIVDLVQSAQDRSVLFVHAEERLIERSGPIPGESIGPSDLLDAAKHKLEYRPRGDGNSWVVVERGRQLVVDISESALDSPEIRELTELLNLQPGQKRYELLEVGGGVPDPMLHPYPATEKLFTTTRSPLQVLFYLANGIEVPAEHVSEGLVHVSNDADGYAFNSQEITRDLFTVHACKGHRPPKCAFVAVRYRDYWYYIDDRDQTSKSTFALVTQLNRLDFGRDAPGAPFLTLPVGRID